MLGKQPLPHNNDNRSISFDTAHDMEQVEIAPTARSIAITVVLVSE